MTLNLTELRDEPLGKHPSQAAAQFTCARIVEFHMTDAEMARVIAADDESVFKIDVDVSATRRWTPATPTLYVLLACIVP